MTITGIATYRWRSLAGIIIYLECVYQFATKMAFVEAEITSTTFNYVEYAFILIFWYTDDGA